MLALVAWRQSRPQQPRVEIRHGDTVIVLTDCSPEEIETELPTSPFHSGMTTSTRTRSSLRPFHQGRDRDAKDVGDADQGGEVGVALRLLQLLTFGAPATFV
ncbi:hypothetical protein ACWD8L_40610 [Streptomyces sp. NPDC005133]